MSRRAPIDRLSAVVFAVATSAFVVHAAAQTLPSGPQTLVDTSFPTVAGNTITVAAGGNLQAAIDSASYGDTISLQAGATFTGSFNLPAKSGSGWIIIRSSAPDASLPPRGTRITPAYAAQLPKIVSSSDAPAMLTDAGASHYRLVGIEFTTTSASSYGLVFLGSDTETLLSNVPTFLILDRVYVHGQPSTSIQRGVALNSAKSAVIDSYISEIHANGFDSQAIAGWNGPGPYKIANNYLEAAGENILFGGSDPSITNLTPSDIEVRGNSMFKPATWRTSSWVVKNLFELKNAQRVLIDGNTFEHNWPAAQNGYSILFTVRNQDGGAPWSVVQDITFTNNIVRHVANAVNILGTDDLHPSQQTKRILIKDNLFDDVNATNWGGFGRLFQLLDGAADVTIDHNTGFQSGEIIVAGGTPNTTFTYRNNLTAHNQYGVAGDNFYGDPAGALSTYFPACVFTHNVLQGGNSTKYPAGNYFPATMADVQFVNLAGGDYRLTPASPFKYAGTDKKDVGISLARGDLNRDGSSDLVLRNYSSGQNALWLMTGTSLKSIADLPALPNTSYRIEGTADFDGDGNNDIVLRNYATGQNALWLMNGTALASIADLPALPNLNFHIEGTGDFNGDGKPDIIIRNYSTGQNAVWLMNGTTLASIVDLPALVNTTYKIESCADFNGDGKTDIVLRNYTSGQNAVWLMNGTALTNIVDLPALTNTSYRIDALGDFNGDQNIDIVLRNYGTGQNAVWMMSGTTLKSVLDLPALPNLSYEINGPR